MQFKFLGGSCFSLDMALHCMLLCLEILCCKIKLLKLNPSLSRIHQCRAVNCLWTCIPDVIVHKLLSRSRRWQEVFEANITLQFKFLGGPLFSLDMALHRMLPCFEILYFKIKLLILNPSPSCIHQIGCGHESLMSDCTN